MVSKLRDMSCCIIVYIEREKPNKGVVMSVRKLSIAIIPMIIFVGLLMLYGYLSYLVGTIFSALVALIAYLLIKLTELSNINHIVKNEFDSFIKQIPVAIAIVDKNMNFLSVSDQWLLDYGLKGVSIIGKNMYVILPNTPNNFHALHDYCLQGHVQVRKEEPFILNDNTISYLNLRIQPWSVIGNKISGLVISSNIVTEQVMSRENLKLSEARLSRAVNGTSDGLWDWDVQTDFIYYSPRFSEILGYKGTELGITFQDFTSKIHPDDLHLVLDRVNEHIYNHLPLDIECRVLNQQQESIWIRLRGSAIWDEEGKPVSLSGFMTDITERKRNEFALKISEERFRLLVNGTKDYAIMMLDEKGLVSTWNRGAEDMIGYKSSEIIGKHISYFYAKDDTMKHQLMESLEAAKECGRYEQEAWQVKKDDSSFFAHVIITPIYDYAGKLLGFSNVERDLTISKKNEIERNALDKTKNEFISIVSHELRTPLTAIHGSMALLSKDFAGKLTEQDDNLLMIAIRNTDRLIRLINDILDIEKIELGKMNFNLMPHDITKIAEEAIVANRAYAEKFSITLKLIKGMPNIFVNIDHDRMIQVFTNLIANAVKFSKKNSEVKISISLNSPTMVRVEVIDDGLGIPIDFRKNIFEKFSQADTSSERGAQGTGLGLNISKSMIEYMGGSINFISEVDKGTTFYFDLPVLKK